MLPLDDEEAEEELKIFRVQLKNVKRYEVVFESAAQAAFQIAVVLSTGS